MVITTHRIIPPHNIRDEIVAEVVLAERNGPVTTLSVERYPVKIADDEIELTAHFAPHNKSMSLAVVQKKETVAHFLFFCPSPCELNFRLPSSQMIRLFCDPAQNAARYEKKA